MSRRDGLKGLVSRGLLAVVVNLAVLLSAVKQKASRPLLALMVVGSVAFVGYLPTTITASPGQEPAPARVSHSAFSSLRLISTKAIVSVMSDCSTCHDMTEDMTVTKPFPPIPHKTDGWGECSFCHAPARLAPLPATHTGMPDFLCQACHRVSPTSPPSLGHALWQDKTCSSCHRASLELPVSHDSRGDLTCVLCHEPLKVEPPLVPHVVETEGLCTGCHSQAELTVAEPRHADWEEGQCSTCHAADPEGVPTVPHAMDRRTDCGFCHMEDPVRLMPGLPAY